MAMVLAGTGIGGLLATGTSPGEARACGLFRPRTGEMPALEVEQVLVLFDAEKNVEHFVREITFTNASKPFGFVVPVPAKPEVAKVDVSPFPKLNERFPFKDPSEGFGDRGVGSGSPAGISKGRGGTVQVLETKKVGSFTAFTIAADDAAAFRRWLDTNQFETSPESERWLAHYVDLRFTYVALRFDGRPMGDATTGGANGAKVSAVGTTSETLRISFPTDVPFYPYLEPTAPAADAPRVLAVWFVSDRARTPVALAPGPASDVPWKRPWREGKRYEDLGRYATTIVFPEGLRKFVPETKPSENDGVFRPASLTVQHFEDQKRSRVGWGDVLFVPEMASGTTTGKDAISTLVRVLDPKTGGAR
ncbi:MAG: DUF2330 domain-containing protein [Polyangiaceae bacterium]